jgi:hypothetical protein
MCFGLEQPTLFALMFHPEGVHPDDPDLLQAQAEIIDTLASATTTIDIGGDHPTGCRRSWRWSVMASAHG